MIDDFRISNVNGEYLPTLIHYERGAAKIMKTSYGVRNQIRLGDPRMINQHEFNFVDNGTRAIVVRTKRDKPTTEDIEALGITSPNCKIDYDGFEEFDTSNWASTYKWNALGHIALNESIHDDGTSVQHKCDSGYDYLHINSVDKDHNGDYLLSARYTDAIYKVSKTNGAILWRLGGAKSDFDVGNLMFRGQHSVRFVEGNDTQAIITILDNAVVDSYTPTHPYSRGLRLVLDFTARPMTVSVLAEHRHPYGDGGYARARGNYQTLPDGNVFIGWSTQAILSEHSENGTLLMDAALEPEWLGSYRNYKFEFVGHPRDPIAVIAEAEDENGVVTTTVHVSWNGATECVGWRVFGQDDVASDSPKQIITSTRKVGFETRIDIKGYPLYVIVEGVDKSDNVIGTSKLIQTKSPADTRKDRQHSRKLQQSDQQLQPPKFGSFVLVLLATASIVMLGRMALRRRWFKRARRRLFVPTKPLPVISEDEQESLHSAFQPRKARPKRPIHQRTVSARSRLV